MRTPISTAAFAASSTTAGPCCLASRSTPWMRRTPAAPSYCVDVRADEPDVRAGRSRDGEQPLHRLGRVRRPIALGDPMPAAFGAQMLAQ